MCSQKLVVGKSEFTRVLLSLFVGCGAKIFSILTFSIMFLFVKATAQSSDIMNFPSVSALSVVSEGRYVWTYDARQLITTLILAPVFENLKIPFVFIVFKFLRATIALPLVIIIIAEYYLHGGGVYGISGASMFFVFSIYYVWLARNMTVFRAYYYTVIAHFSSNLIALGFSLF